MYSHLDVRDAIWGQDNVDDVIDEAVFHDSVGRRVWSLLNSNFSAYLNNNNNNVYDLLTGLPKGEAGKNKM